MLEVYSDGGGPATTAGAGVNSNAVCALIPGQVPFFQGGDLKAIAVFGLELDPTWSDVVPTFKELGYEFFSLNRAGLATPVKIPQHVIDTIHHALKTAMEEGSLSLGDILGNS